MGPSGRAKNQGVTARRGRRQGAHIDAPAKTYQSRTAAEARNTSRSFGARLFGASMHRHRLDTMDLLSLPLLRLNSIIC